MVEKPFCVISAECDEVIEAAKKTDKLLTVYQSKYPYDCLMIVLMEQTADTTPTSSPSNL